MSQYTYSFDDAPETDWWAEESRDARDYSNDYDGAPDWEGEDTTDDGYWANNPDPWADSLNLTPAEAQQIEDAVYADILPDEDIDPPF